VSEGRHASEVRHARVRRMRVMRVRGEEAMVVVIRSSLTTTGHRSKGKMNVVISFQSSVTVTLTGSMVRAS
jgi:hypothetical protein